jgi:hypothetical protein
MLLAGENRLLEDLYQLGQAVRSEGARKHVKAGLSRRHQMLQSCRLWLRERCLTKSGTLSPSQVVDLNLYVNVYYVTLCGSLDNLAWALAYECQLHDPINELDRNTQRLISFGSRKFRERLGTVAAPVAMRIAGSLDWYLEVRRFRDPAAHRLPLSVVAGILDENDHAEYQRLQKEASAAFQARDLDKGFALTHDASMLGKFRPWLEHPEGSTADFAFYSIPRLIARDQAFYVDTLGTVTRLMLKRLDLSPVTTRFSGWANPATTWTVGAYLKQDEPFRPPL